MLRKNSETFMLSPPAGRAGKAQREYFNHPSEPEAHAPLEQTHPAKNVRRRLKTRLGERTQDAYFLCAASKQSIAQNSCLRNISEQYKISALASEYFHR